jgi:hypothetical protein
MQNSGSPARYEPRQIAQVPEFVAGVRKARAWVKLIA